MMSAGPPPVRAVTRSTGPRRAVAATRPATSLPGRTSPSATDAPAEGPSEASSGALAAVDQSDAALGVEQGIAAFLTPPPMPQGVFTTLKFVAGPSLAAITKESEGKALEATSDIYVGKAMRVTLLDNPSFEIKPLSEDKQLTLRDKTATWIWNVRPINDRNTILTAQIEVYAVKDDDSFGRLLERYQRTVEVKVQVSGAQRFSEAADEGSNIADKFTKLFGSWQKTVGALVALIGALGLLAWRLGLRKTKPAE